MTPEEIEQFIQDNGVAMIDVKFTDRDEIPD